MTINEIQDEIISEFSLLDGDMEMTVFISWNWDKNSRT